MAIMAETDRLPDRAELPSIFDNSSSGLSLFLTFSRFNIPSTTLVVLGIGQEYSQS